MPTQILLGKDGRPSMLGVYGHTQGPIKVVVRRRLPNGKQWYRVYENNNSSVRRKVKIDALSIAPVVIRWGARIPIETEGKIVYNHAQAIERATNKKESRKLLLEKGVSCPKLVTVSANTFPIIARPSKHAKGKNFVILKNKKDFVAHFKANESKGWYYSEFIDKDREYRVHTAHGKVLEVMQKPKGTGIAWNRAVTGEPFVRVPREQYDSTPNLKDICVEALKATSALGLDFSGVDVIVHNGKPYVLELNTSPTLNSSPHVTQRYAKYFDWLARSDTKRPHWNYKNFKKAKSLVWKDFQLNSNDNPSQETETP